jgi:hypothetical protein
VKTVARSKGEVVAPTCSSGVLGRVSERTAGSAFHTRLTHHETYLTSSCFGRVLPDVPYGASHSDSGGQLAGDGLALGQAS